MANPTLIPGFDTNNTNTEAIPLALQDDGYGELQVLESKHYNEGLRQLFAAANKNKNDGLWEWEDPAGGNTEYNIGSLVRHLGVNYQSLVDLNTATPTNDLVNWGAMSSNDVPNMTSLLTTSVNNGTINLIGYTTANDGGGGIFNWDITIDKSTANAGTIIDPSVSLANQGTGVGLGCWVRQYSGAVNVKWFGANETRTDNETIFNQILNDGFRDVYVPKGTYSFSGSVYLKKCRLTGAGQNSTVLKLLTNDHMFIIENSDTTWSGGRNPAKISDIFIYGAGNEDTNYAFYAYGVEVGSTVAYSVGLTITDVYIENMGGGFYISDFFRVHIDRIGMSVVSNPLKVVGSVVQSTFSKIVCNTTSPQSSLEKVGFRFIDKTYTSLQGSENCTLLDCSAAGYDYGLIISGARLLFKANRLDLDFIKYIGVKCSGSFIMENSWIAMSNSTSIAKAIQIDQSDTVSENIKFKNIEIQGYAGLFAGSRGVSIGDGSTNRTYGVSLESIYIKTGTFTYPIYAYRTNELVLEKIFIPTSGTNKPLTITSFNGLSIKNSYADSTSTLSLTPATSASTLILENNTGCIPNKGSSSAVLDYKKYVTTSGSHTVVVTGLYDTLGGSLTKALVELTLIGIDPVGSDSTYAKVLLPLTGFGDWSIGTPVTISGTALTITEVSSTNTSVTFTVSSLASDSILTANIQATKVSTTGILLLA